MTPILVLLLGLLITYVAGSCLWAFVCDLPVYGWSSDFALGVSSVVMLLVGGVLTGYGFLYAVWQF